MKAARPFTSPLALDIRVLDRLAGANEAELHAVRVGPRLQGTASKLRPVVQHDRPRQSDCQTQVLEYSDHARTGQRPIDFDGDALAAEVVHDVQRAKRPAVSERVRHEVH